ncbi:Hypothetical protein ORPV_541 [Orpheovirus IHUMI-LCC2]|uniref:Uncharacterized protein n=1 Tax=Orpheovirus IHUMI-LCC2 TaxID=2023057 RepID=A0A2I2L4G2_9VIRU|nr:Hypothetical protein ORPV_541 [Orpheovirus IHUMI-LCC2]SNW62445.1 Hypothetical protein ORPV_541 [Orpheovirus IHUMI-LCC2]
MLSRLAKINLILYNNLKNIKKRDVTYNYLYAVDKLRSGSNSFFLPDRWYEKDNDIIIDCKDNIILGRLPQELYNKLRNVGFGVELCINKEGLLLGEVRTSSEGKKEWSGKIQYKLHNKRLKDAMEEIMLNNKGITKDGIIHLPHYVVDMLVTCDNVNDVKLMEELERCLH